MVRIKSSDCQMFSLKGINIDETLGEPLDGLLRMRELTSTDEGTVVATIAS